MQIVNTANRYSIYNDSIQTFDLLPVQTYRIINVPMAGLFLEKISPLEVKGKVYGEHEKKAEKVLRTFSIVDRNLGVILSGEKGIGKSLCARIMTAKALARGIPVILVDEAIPGLANFINNIEQECLVLFDEFEKVFAEEEAQTSLLSLFDGTSVGKKLFVITCNNIRRLNDVMINRPGRFHYHFRFTNPSEAEIKEYLEDQLDPKYYNEIDKVVTFNSLVKLNYDCLRAIAFELNSGTVFEEAIKDLNIVHAEANNYNVSLYMDNGDVLTRKERIDLFNTNDCLDITFYSKLYNLEVSWDSTALKASAEDKTLRINGKDLIVEWFDWNDDDDDDDSNKKKKVKKEKPESLYMIFKAVDDYSIHYDFGAF